MVTVLAILIGYGVAMAAACFWPRFRFEARIWMREAVAWVQWKAAYLVPREVALLVFVRVYCAGMDHPGDDYAPVYAAWENGAGR
jgi:hypothetical protein